MRAVKCDRCQGVLCETRAAKLPQGWMRVHIAIGSSKDLCPECVKDFRAFLKGRDAKETAKS